MGRRGRIQYRLTGSYTRHGYYSFVPQLSKELEYLWVLEGPAGIGKPCFIRTLGENLASQGYEVEFWLSAMDPGSAEGIFIPLLNAAVINGSLLQPAADPFPGVKIEVINLGEGFYAHKVEEWHQELATMAARILHHNRLAENLLENSLCLEACSIEEWSGRVDKDKLIEKIKELEASIFEPLSQERHFYACSLTIDGLVDYIKDLSRECRRRYILQGPPGCGQKEIFAQVLGKARQMGMTVEHYHWALDPDRTCLLLIPQLRTAILEDAFLSTGRQPGDVMIDMSAMLKPGVPEYKSGKIRKRMEALFLQVQVELEEVYKTYREMRRIHTGSIDHSWMERQQDEVARKITQYLDNE